MKGMIHHQDGNIGKNEWLTDPAIIHSLGEFDLDPSAPIVRPWDTAVHHFTILDNGLMQDWFGRVWLNPPYDSRTLDLWMSKMAKHNNGVSLIFARTDRNTFHNFIFPVADSILFIQQRLKFFHVNGVKAKGGGGAPSVLIAYGEQNSDALAECGMKGHHILLNRVSVVVIGLDSTWKVIVKTVLIRLNSEASLNSIYQEVEKLAPDKVRQNKHYQEKVRQQLQMYFKRVRKGVYKINQS